MKHLKFIPFLLLLLLTGCSDGQTGVPADPLTGTEPSAGITQAVTEAETAPPTQAGTDAQRIPMREQEDLAYAFIQEELVPMYRLSDTAFFETVDWEEGCAVPVPPLTQGLVSAYIHDMDGDQNAELLTVRVTEFEYIADVYVPVGGGSFMPLDSEVLASYDAMSDVRPAVSMQGNTLLVRMDHAAVPGYSSFGTQITAYCIDRRGITQTAQIGVHRSPGWLFASVNDAQFESPEEPDTMDYPVLRASMEQAFADAGVECGDVHFGWGYGNEYGAEVAFPGEIMIFMTDHVPDSGTFFLDSTGLREHLM